MEPARIRIEFGHDFIHTIVSVDGVTRPYKKIDIHMEYDKIVCTLTRNIGNDGLVTEELLAHPIVETFEASPFEPVVRGHGPGINQHYAQELPPPIIHDVYQDTHDLVAIIEDAFRQGIRI
jgi:hypothetical protein